MKWGTTRLRWRQPSAARGAPARELSSGGSRRNARFGGGSPEAIRKLPESEIYLQKSAATRRVTGDVTAELALQTELSEIAMARGDLNTAERRAESVVRLMDDPGDDSLRAAARRVTAAGAGHAAAQCGSGAVPASAGCGARGTAFLRFDGMRGRYISEGGTTLSEIQSRLLTPDTFLLLNFKASRQAYLSGRLKDRGNLHFAVHVIFNTDGPDLSGLVLSTVRVHSLGV